MKNASALLLAILIASNPLLVFAEEESDSTDTDVVEEELEEVAEEEEETMDPIEKKIDAICREKFGYAPDKELSSALLYTFRRCLNTERYRIENAERGESRSFRRRLQPNEQVGRRRRYINQRVRPFNTRIDQLKTQSQRMFIDRKNSMRLEQEFQYIRSRRRLKERARLYPERPARQTQERAFRTSIAEARDACDDQRGASKTTCIRDFLRGEKLVPDTSTVVEPGN